MGVGKRKRSCGYKRRGKNGPPKRIEKPGGANSAAIKRKETQ
jgi:hypothetical protein